MVFFFKQKTAYEVRISDWSSDVCSSDLQHHVALAVVGAQILDGPVSWRIVPGRSGGAVGEGDDDEVAGPVRSEEHTSELQSLMRISYAVFCLKKKQNNEELAESTRVR